VHLGAYHREPPDLDVGAALEELGHRPRLRPGITTVPVDAVDDEQGFTLSQEIPGLMRLVREIDQSPVTDDTKETCERAFDDEDPYLEDAMSTQVYRKAYSGDNLQRQPFRPSRPLSCIKP
jgi:hypothetical protein